MENAIEVRHLSYTYPGDDMTPPVRALCDVSFTVERGSFTVILGHNGSGKSTLASLICMLAEPDSGDILIDGKNYAAENVTEDEIFEARRKVGMVFQNPDNQIVASIVEEDVAFGCENLGVPSAEIRKRVDEALDTVGMRKYARHSPHKLSGGQKQRVAIAGVIAMKRETVIFDESTAMLDPMGRREVMETIERLNRQEGITVVLITHYMEEAARGDKIIVMNGGRVLTSGTPSEVFSHPRMLWDASLDVPQTTELLWYMRKTGLSLPLDLFGCEKCADGIAGALKEHGSFTPYSQDEKMEDKRNSEAVFELRGVSYIYNRGTPYETRALNNIDLSLRRGEITGIIGHTGSGKSTMMQLLNGLLKPTEGQVLLEGRDIWDKSSNIRDVRFKAGLVMQYPEYQLFAQTVYDDIAFGPRNMGLDEDEVRRRCGAAAAFADVPKELMSRSPFDLSGGQKRRVALAGIIAMSPSVLILDEPAAGLDPGGRRAILGGIREYREASGTSVIVVSHSMEDMAAYCDRIVVMASGSIIMDGTPAEVFSRSDELLSVGLDVPQITRIAAALADRGYDIGRDIYTVSYAARRITECMGCAGRKVW